MRWLLSCLLLGAAYAQDIQTLFGKADELVLAQLISASQNHNAAVKQAQASLGAEEANTELSGQLLNALTVNAGVSAEGGLYEQFAPRYQISVSLNVNELLQNSNQLENLSASLDEALLQARLNAVEGFVRYKVALETAEAAAAALEGAEAAFRVVSDHLEIGEATLSDQLRARAAVSDAAIALLKANGETIMALEALATRIGLSPEETLNILKGKL
jgi:outer membrane protein TolC